MKKPGRTLGLSIAILASVFLFSLLPLMQIGLVLGIQYRYQNYDYSVPNGDGSVQPFAVGTSLSEGADTGLMIQAIFGLTFLVIAVFAWRGKPSFIRWVMFAAVLILTAIAIVTTILSLTSTQNLQTGIDSGESLRNTLLMGRLLMTILIPLYVVWYINRGPARAFYRGYYLQRPQEETKE